MKKCVSGLTVLLLVTIFSLSANADPGDLYVQIDLRDTPDVLEDQCSILKVLPNGTLSEFISFEDILDLTGEDTCDMDDTPLTVADNGDVYFSEDISDNVFMATPGGALSIFVTEAQIVAITGEVEGADLEQGMVIGPDGDLYFTDEQSDFVFKASIPGGILSVVVTEDEIEAVTGNTDADLQGGIAFDCEGNLYITDSHDSEGNEGSILILTPEGDLSIFVTEQEIEDVTGSPVNLERAMTFSVDSLFLNDDDDCDCVYRVNVNNKDISVFIPESRIIAVTGNDSSDLDGGIAIDQGRNVFLGDDGNSPDAPNILRSFPDGRSLSIFVSTQELRDFYTPPFNRPRLKGSMAFEAVDECRVPDPIPTLSEWGLIATAAVLGLAGLYVIRRRRAAI